jgi:hypothetical protein
MFANLQVRSMLSALTSTKSWATALILPAAVVFAAVAGANPGGELTAPAGDDPRACCPEMMAAPAAEVLSAASAAEVPLGAPAAEVPLGAPAADALLAAPAAEVLSGAPAPEAPEATPEISVVPAALVEQGAMSLSAGVVPEQGLQVKTILAARSVSAAFPQIRSAIGVRPDAKPWHPSGRAIDLMIPNPGSAEGIALGDAILAFVMDNAGRFGVQDVIWRGTYYTPGGGASGSGYGHYDHVHITTIGGGYPTGGEDYPVG